MGIPFALPFDSLTLHPYSCIMRLSHLLLIIDLFAGIALGRVSDYKTLDVVSATESATTEQQSDTSEVTKKKEFSSGVEVHPRDVTQNLEYRCAGKWGSCPSGTCCSSAGKLSFQEMVRREAHTHSQASVARPKRTVAPQTARSISATAMLTSLPRVHRPKKFFVLKSVKWHMARSRSARARFQGRSP